MPKVLVSRRIPEAGLRLLRTEAEVVVLQTDEEQPPDREALLAGARDADVLLTLLTEAVDHELLTVNPRLRGVAQMAVGYDNIDWSTATRLGIPVANTPGVLTETTADFTWAMLLSVARRTPEAHAYTADGRFRIWGPNLFLGSDVGPGAEGVPKVLGIVGYGRIGEAVARRAIGFGMRILAHSPRSRARIDADPKVEWASLDDLLEASDFVTLHPPLTAETHHLIDAAALARMRSSAYLINAARGPVIDEKALVEALRDGHLAGAALDVFEHEPALAPGLAELPNVCLFPHIASATHDTRSTMATMAATNAIAHLQRRPAPHCVDHAVYQSPAYRQRMAL